MLFLLQSQANFANLLLCLPDSKTCHVLPWFWPYNMGKCADMYIYKYLCLSLPLSLSPSCLAAHERQAQDMRKASGCNMSPARWGCPCQRSSRNQLSPHATVHGRMNNGPSPCILQTASLTICPWGFKRWRISPTTPHCKVLPPDSLRPLVPQVHDPKPRQTQSCLLLTKPNLRVPTESRIAVPTESRIAAGGFLFKWPHVNLALTTGWHQKTTAKSDNCVLLGALQHVPTCHATYDLRGLAAMLV